MYITTTTTILCSFLKEFITPYIKFEVSHHHHVLYLLTSQ